MEGINMSNQSVFGKVCKICGSTTYFLDDSKYEDWMNIIERLRKEGKIEFRVRETNELKISAFSSQHEYFLKDNRLESKASKSFREQHELYKINPELITRNSASGCKKILKDTYMANYGAKDGIITYECDYHDVWTWSNDFIEQEQEFGPIFFQTISNENSYSCSVCGNNHFLDMREIKQPAARPFSRARKKAFSKEQQEQSKRRVDIFITNSDKTDISAIIPQNHIAAENVILFLNHLIKLEKSIRTTTEHLYNLELIFEKRNRKAYIQTFKDCENLEKEYNKKIQTITQALEFATQKYAHTEAVYESRGLIAPTKPKPVPEFSVVLPTEPIPIKAGLFNRAKVSAQNEANLKEYQNKLQEYKTAKEKYEEQMRLYDEAMKVYEKENTKYTQLCLQMNAILDKECQEECAKLNFEKDNILKQREQALSDLRKQQKSVPTLAFVIKEVEETKTLLRNLLEARGKLRCSGVLHPKYFDIAAVATICEYFETGRAETLAGPTGAYNLYESELRSNIIISKLDTIISSLEQIKQNQFKLYNVLCSINDGIENMSGLLNKANESLDNITVQNEKIIENTAVTAYYAEKTAKYAKINAELTNALGFLVALK